MNGKFTVLAWRHVLSEGRCQRNVEEKLGALNIARKGENQSKKIGLTFCVNRLVSSSWRDGDLFPSVLITRSACKDSVSVSSTWLKGSSGSESSLSDLPKRFLLLIGI